MDQWHLPYLGACQKSRYQAVPHNYCIRIYILTRYPDDCSAYESLRSIGVDTSFKKVNYEQRDNINAVHRGKKLFMNFITIIKQTKHMENDDRLGLKYMDYM